MIADRRLDFADQVPAARGKPRYCPCGESTRNGKPFCSRHLESGSASGRIISDLAQRQREVAMLGQPGRADPDRFPFMAAEVITALASGGPTTAAGLAKEIAWGEFRGDSLAPLLRALCASGEVVSLGEVRGHVVYGVTT